MLSQDDRHRLDALDAAMRAQDRKFAEGMRLGRPCLPREYRRLRFRRVLVAALTIAATAVAVATVLW
jgi:Protein of unknown function (DUF3040)